MWRIEQKNDDEYCLYNHSMQCVKTFGETHLPMFARLVVEINRSIEEAVTQARLRASNTWEHTLAMMEERDDS